MLNRRSLFLGVIAAMVLACVSAASAADANPAAISYQIYCARCHGDVGHGDGPDGASLSTTPQDFTNCPAMAKLTDETIFKAIKDGGASVGRPADMPAWGGGLSDDKIHQLVGYVRHFCNETHARKDATE